MAAFLVLTMDPAAVLAGPLETAVLEAASLVLAAVSLVLAVRAWRAGLSANGTGITVRNLWSTQDFPWDDVEDFRLGEHRLIPFPVLTVHLKDGRTVRVTNIAPPNLASRPNNREAAHIAEALRKRLSEETDR